MVRELAGAGVSPANGLPEILIYGGGGHGKALIDLLRSLGTYHLAGVVTMAFRLGRS